MAAKVKTHMTVKEIAAASGLSPVTIVRRITEGVLPATKSEIVGRGRAPYQVENAIAKDFVKKTLKLKKK